MQEDPSRNRYNGIIYEQTNNYVPNPYEKLCEFGEIMWVRRNYVKVEMNIPTYIN